MILLLDLKNGFRFFFSCGAILFVSASILIKLLLFQFFLSPQIDWEDEKNCLQGVGAALGNFYAMHPPLLPNPSGDGLQFYKKKTSRNPGDEGTSTNDIGTKDIIRALLVFLVCVGVLTCLKYDAILKYPLE